MNLENISFVPMATVCFTEAEVKHLMASSQLHYDHKCQSAGLVGGFLYGIHHAIKINIPQTRHMVTHSLSNGQLQILSKILEAAPPSIASEEGCLMAGYGLTRDREMESAIELHSRIGQVLRRMATVSTLYLEASES